MRCVVYIHAFPTTSRTQECRFPRNLDGTNLDALITLQTGTKRVPRDVTLLHARRRLFDLKDLLRFDWPRFLFVSSRCLPFVWPLSLLDWPLSLFVGPRSLSNVSWPQRLDPILRRRLLFFSPEPQKLDH